MLEHQEFLFLIAELAVAMAGFTGVVAVFQQTEKESAKPSTVSFVTMLRSSLSALVLSLVPYLLFTLTDSAEITWVLAPWSIILVMGWNLRGYVIMGGLRNENRFSNRVMFPGGILVWLTNVLGAFQVFNAADTFVLAVSYQLIVSTHNFAKLVLVSSPK